MPDKSLGQHWLKDRLILEAIADFADIQPTDTVLEIGAGLGTLTSVLLDRADRVVSVEFDRELAKKLPGQFPGKNLQVENADILSFDLTQLPLGYKVVANVPYYITSKIIQTLSVSANPASVAVLLVQKEVAERLAAKQGDMSILALSAQIFWEVSLGSVVGAEWFTPAPKVDSQVIVMRRREEPLVSPEKQKVFFRVVKAGFSAKRKKMRSSLAGGLGITKPEAENILKKSGISPDIRAQDLSVDDWLKLAESL